MLSSLALTSRTFPDISIASSDKDRPCLFPRLMIPGVDLKKRRRRRGEGRRGTIYCFTKPLGWRSTRPCPSKIKCNATTCWLSREVHRVSTVPRENGSSQINLGRHNNGLDSTHHPPRLSFRRRQVSKKFMGVNPTAPGFLWDTEARESKKLA